MTALALRLKRSGHIPVLAAAGCTVVLLLVGSMYSQNFLSADYLLLQLQIASFLGIIATGAMLVFRRSISEAVTLACWFTPWMPVRNTVARSVRGKLVGAIFGAASAISSSRRLP